MAWLKSVGCGKRFRVNVSVALKLSTSIGCQNEVKWGILKRLHMEEITPESKEFLERIQMVFRKIDENDEKFRVFLRKNYHIPKRIHEF